MGKQKTFAMKVLESLLFFTGASSNTLEAVNEKLSLLQLQDECISNCYEIEVITSNDAKSGTDDKVEIQLEGQNGTISEWFELDSPKWFYNDFETNLKTTYFAQFESTEE